jgi:hypothetical protein
MVTEKYTTLTEVLKKRNLKKKALYNKHMHDVDTADQQMAYYLFLLTSVKWTKTVFMHMLHCVHTHKTRYETWMGKPS